MVEELPLDLALLISLGIKHSSRAFLLYIFYIYVTLLQLGLSGSVLIAYVSELFVVQSPLLYIVNCN